METNYISSSLIQKCSISYIEMNSCHVFFKEKKKSVQYNKIWNENHKANYTEKWSKILELVFHE